MNKKVIKLKQKLRRGVIEHYYNPNVPCTCEGLFADTHRIGCKRRSKSASERWIEEECEKLAKPAPSTKSQIKKEVDKDYDTKEWKEEQE